MLSACVRACGARAGVFSGSEEPLDQSIHPGSGLNYSRAQLPPPSRLLFIAGALHTKRLYSNAGTRRAPDHSSHAGWLHSLRWTGSQPRERPSRRRRQCAPFPARPALFSPIKAREREGGKRGRERKGAGVEPLLPGRAAVTSVSRMLW